MALDITATSTHWTSLVGDWIRNMQAPVILPKQEGCGFAGNGAGAYLIKARIVTFISAGLHNPISTS
jgi:hypothetical protein